MTDTNRSEGGRSPGDREDLLLRAHIASLGGMGRKKIREMLTSPENWPEDPEKAFSGAEQYLSRLRDKTVAEKIKILYNRDICKCSKCGEPLITFRMDGRYMLC